MAPGRCKGGTSERATNPGKRRVPCRCAGSGYMCVACNHRNDQPRVKKLMLCFPRSLVTWWRAATTHLDGSMHDWTGGASAEREA